MGIEGHATEGSERSRANKSSPMRVFSAWKGPQACGRGNYPRDDWGDGRLTYGRQATTAYSGQGADIVMQSGGFWSYDQNHLFVGKLKMIGLSAENQ